MKRILAVLLSTAFLIGCGVNSNNNNTTPPAISVAIAPSSQTTLDQGQTAAFTATVANDSSNGGVGWTMSGTNCSGTACGTFTSSSTTGATYNTPTSVTSQLTVTVTATSVTDTTKSANATVMVNPPLAIATTTLTSGTVGQAYSATLAATGGSGTVAWTVSTGSLPAGLTLSGGKIAGTPTASGTSAFTVKATDSATTPVAVTQPLSLTINNPGLAINTPSLPNGIVGQAYNQSVAASGGTSPYTWNVSAGSLPAGLSLTPSNGAIAGSPTAAGPYTFTITVTDSTTPTAQTQQQQYTVTIAGALSITTTSLPNGNVGTAYSQTLTATGGTGTLTWSIVSGSLPSPLIMSNSGAITGTPTATGTSNFKVQVADQGTPPQTQSLPLAITINGASGGTLTITTTQLPTGAVGTVYSAAVNVSGGTPPYTFSLSSGSLPAGLQLNTSTGVIYGTPTAAATSNFSISVADSDSHNAGPQALSITISAVQACTDTGSNSLLSGQYGFVLAGFNSSGYAAVIGSFTADGNGNITGGEVDSNGAFGSQTQISINTAGSSYSVGSTQLGCLTLATSFGIFNTRIAVGTFNSGVATAGQIVEWDVPGSSTYFAATGQLAQQTASAFATGPSGNYAFKQFGDGSVGAVGAMTASGGALTAGEIDFNSAGSTNHMTGMTGSYQSADSNGRFTVTTTWPGNSPTHAVAYIVSGAQFAFMPTDSGQAAIGEFMQQTGTLSAASLNATMVLYMEGLSGGGTGDVVLQIFSGDGVSTVTGTGAEWDGGKAATWSSLGSCPYSVSSDGLGRVTFSGSCSDSGYPILYLIAANKGYVVAGSESPLVGNFDPQVAPTGGFSSGLSGTLFGGDADVVSWAEASAEQVGLNVITFSGGNGALITDYTSSSANMGQQADQTQSITTPTINSNGTFNTNPTGAPNGVVINASKSVAVDNSSQTYPVIMVIKQ